MKNTLTILALLSSGTALAGQVPGPKTSFKFDCKWAQASAVNGDVEFIGLGLDVNAEQHPQTRRCEIRTEFPAQAGKKLVVSTFQVEGRANLKDKWSVAIVTLKHNFKGWGWKTQDARANNKSGDVDLAVTATAIGTANCGEPVVLDTEILTAARNARFIQDAANQITSNIKYSYEKCW